ncbi:hypothetical protein BT69DRAFT_1217474, partial [Atractiella rhizophila]
TEVSLVCEAREILQKEGLKVRVVSLPCWEVFEEQSQEYKLSILLMASPGLSYRALLRMPVCSDPYSGHPFGLDTRVGVSAPHKDVDNALKLTSPNISEKTKKVIAHYRGVKLLSPINNRPWSLHLITRTIRL